MTKSRKIRVHNVLNDFLAESLHPEMYDTRTWTRLKKYQYNHEPGRPLPAPRYRLTRRLQLISYLQEWINKLMKEVIADVESLEDAKAHREQEEKS